MRSMKTVGAFVKSNGITKNSYCPYLVLNVVLRVYTSQTLNGWYLDLKSILENTIVQDF